MGYALVGRRLAYLVFPALSSAKSPTLCIRYLAYGQAAWLHRLCPVFARYNEAYVLARTLPFIGVFGMGTHCATAPSLCTCHIRLVVVPVLSRVEQRVGRILSFYNSFLTFFFLPAFPFIFALDYYYPTSRSQIYRAQRTDIETSRRRRRTFSWSRRFRAYWLSSCDQGLGRPLAGCCHYGRRIKPGCTARNRCAYCICFSLSRRSAPAG